MKIIELIIDVSVETYSYACCGRVYGFRTENLRLALRSGADVHEFCRNLANPSAQGFKSYAVRTVISGWLVVPSRSQTQH